MTEFRLRIDGEAAAGPAEEGQVTTAQGPLGAQPARLVVDLRMTCAATQPPVVAAASRAYEAAEQATDDAQMLAGAWRWPACSGPQPCLGGWAHGRVGGRMEAWADGWVGGSTRRHAGGWAKGQAASAGARTVAERVPVQTVPARSASSLPAAHVARQLTHGYASGRTADAAGSALVVMGREELGHWMRQAMLQVGCWRERGGGGGGDVRARRGSREVRECLRTVAVQQTC